LPMPSTKAATELKIRAVTTRADPFPSHRFTI